MTKIQLFASAAIVMGLAGIAAPLIIQQYAKNDVLFTHCPPGRAKLLVKGGDLSDIILNLPGYHLNVRGRPGYDPNVDEWEIVRNQEGRDDSYYEYRFRPTGAAGAYWVGFLRKVYKYQWNWMERNQHQTEASPKKYLLRDEETEYIVVNDFTYFFETEDVETKDGLLSKMFYSITVRINNPQKSVYNVDNWLVSLETIASKIGKDYIGEHDFLQLRSENDKDGASPETQKYFSEHVLAYNRDKPVSSEGPGGTQERWGVTIVNVNVEDVSLVGKTADENQDAARRLFLAKRLAEAALAKAQGDAAVTMTAANAEAAAKIVVAKATERELAAYATQPELAQTKIVAEALKGAGSTIIVADGSLVNAFAGVAKTMRSKTHA